MKNTTVAAAVMAVTVSVFGINYFLDESENRSKRNVNDMCISMSARALHGWDVMVEMRSEGENIFDDFMVAEYYTHQPFNDAFRESMSTSRSQFEAAGKMLSRCLGIYYQSCGEKCLPNSSLWTRRFM